MPHIGPILYTFAQSTESSICGQIPLCLIMIRIEYSCKDSVPCRSAWGYLLNPGRVVQSAARYCSVWHLTLYRFNDWKGQWHENFDHPFSFMILSNLGTIIHMWSIFVYSFDFAEVFASSEHSVVSLTPLRQTKHCHWHRRVQLSSVIHNADSDLVFFFILTRRFHEIFVTFFFKIQTPLDHGLLG